MRRGVIVLRIGAVLCTHQSVSCTHTLRLSLVLGLSSCFPSTPPTLTSSAPHSSHEYCTLFIARIKSIETIEHLKNMTHTKRIVSTGPKHSDAKGHIIDPTKTAKRSGAGKGNWGSAVDDIDDLPESVVLMKARRRSNSQSNSWEREKMMSKFEAEVVPEEVF